MASLVLFAVLGVVVLDGGATVVRAVRALWAWGSPPPVARPVARPRPVPASVPASAPRLRREDLAPALLASWGR